MSETKDLGVVNVCKLCCGEWCDWASFQGRIVVPLIVGHENSLYSLMVSTVPDRPERVPVVFVGSQIPYCHYAEDCKMI